MINELTASDTPWLDHKNDGNNEPVITSSDVIDSTKEFDKHSPKGAFEAPELSSQEGQRVSYIGERPRLFQIWFKFRCYAIRSKIG